MTLRSKTLLGTLGTVLLVSSFAAAQAQETPQKEAEDGKQEVTRALGPTMPPSPFRPQTPPQPIESPSQPLPPGATSRVGGAPFPSMVSPPGQTQGRPNVLLSSEAMKNNDADIRQRLQRMSSDVEQRMAGLRIGTGQLPPPALEGRGSELQARAMAERQIREIELRQREIEAAIKLWATTYDPRREEDAKKAQTGRGNETSPSPNRSGNNATNSPAPPSRNTNSAAATSTRPQNASSSAPRTGDMPLPKIVSITGGGDVPLRALLLVPYVGEVHARVGTVLPAGRTVLRINEDAVIVSDTALGETNLGFGDAVPLAPPSSRGTQTQENGNSRSSAGQPFLPPTPFQAN